MVNNRKAELAYLTKIDVGLIGVWTFTQTTRLTYSDLYKIVSYVL